MYQMYLTIKLVQCVCEQGLYVPCTRCWMWDWIWVRAYKAHSLVKTGCRLPSAFLMESANHFTTTCCTNLSSDTLYYTCFDQPESHPFSLMMLQANTCITSASLICICQKKFAFVWREKTYLGLEEMKERANQLVSSLPWHKQVKVCEQGRPGSCCVQ